MNDKKIIDGNWHGLEGRWGVGIESWNSRIKENLISESCADMSRSPCWNPTGSFLVSSRPGLPQVLSLAMAYGKSDRCVIFFFCFHRHWLGREIQATVPSMWVKEEKSEYMFYFWSLGSLVVWKCRVSFSLRIPNNFIISNFCVCGQHQITIIFQTP